VPGERRTEDEIRGEIATERGELETALADLKQGIDAKRRPATVVGVALAAGLATLATLKVRRLVRGR